MVSAHSKEPSIDEDRPIKNVVAPKAYPLPHDQLFQNNTINLENLRCHLKREGRLLKATAIHLVSTASEVFRKEPNLLALKDPITVCGDIHGQFFDLLRLMEAAGNPAETQYLFLGDYVDRGCFSIECVFWLYALKITFPKTFWMLRGNHECRHLTSYFNFKDECLYKYDEELYIAIMDSFDCLPISGVINEKFFACHGGLSPDIALLSDINDINRFQEIPTKGPFCDLMWADPVAEEEENQEEVSSDEGKDPVPTWFAYNETRQCSYCYGIDAVTAFLDTNNLTSIIRAHEACFDGYKFLFVCKDTEVPRVITIFSAPNYCDVYKNKAACIKFQDSTLNIRQYSSSPHPYYLPNFMDVITWSMPFAAEKVCELLNDVLSFAVEKIPTIEEPTSKNIKDMLSEQKLVQQKMRQKMILRDKIAAVTRMRRFFNVIKEENENIVKLKALTPSGRLPAGILRKGSAAIVNAVSGFFQAKEADKRNMQLPGPIRSKTEEPKHHVRFRKSGILFKRRS